jgi:sortase (surface protein transpeptidase)
MTHGLEIRQKREGHPILWSILAAIVILLAVSGWLGLSYFNNGSLPLGITVRALQADPGVDESDVSDEQIKDHIVRRDEPRYITIPKLSLGKSRVIGLDIDVNNNLKAPDNIADTAWYSKSARPGLGYGTIIINAHNSGIDRDGAFANLDSLVNGDIIEIERGDGEIFTYIVTENRSMPLKEAMSTGMKSVTQPVESNKESLSLITNDGKWIPKIKQFDRRIILRAVIQETSSKIQ